MTLTHREGIAKTCLTWCCALGKVSQLFYGVVPVNFIYPYPLNPAILLKISQVGDRLSGGEPLLRQWKSLPAVAFDVPRHPGCDLIGRQVAISDDA